jgi:hypothetical protein
VLFSPLSTALGGGYYRIDPQVRWHCLTLLQLGCYRDEPRPRLRRVAELLWRYVEMAEQRASRAADPQLAEFLDIQRWVALAILEPASAAHAFADALRQATTGPASAVLRLGGLTAAIEMPLASEQELLAYARGMNALVGGDEERARQLLEALGDEEIRVGAVVLKAPTALLAERLPAPVGEAAAAAATSAPRPICLVLIASGGRSEIASGRLRDSERAWALIRTAVTALEMDCVRVDEVRSADDSGRALYTQLLKAALVVCDLSDDDPGVHYLLGVCWALRPAGTLLLAEQNQSIRFASDSWTWPSLLRYELPGDDHGFAPSRFTEALRAATAEHDSPFLRNPVYRQLPLQPPEFGAANEAGVLAEAGVTGKPEDLCLVVQGFGRKTDPQSGRTLDLDASWRIIRDAVKRAAGLPCVRADEQMASGGDLYSLLLRARLVIADLSAGVPEALLQLGLRCGLRPGKMLVIADAKQPVPVDLAGLDILRYTHPDNSLGARKAAGWPAELSSAIRAALARATVDSPVYLALPGLRPPRLAPRGVDAEGSGAASEAAPAEVIEDTAATLAATADTVTARLFTIRLHGKTGLRFILESPPAPERNEWTLSYPREIMDPLLASLRQASPRLDRELATVLADLLLPRELAALAPARAYRLIVAGEAAALPWELILGYRPRGWQPVSVLRRLDGLHVPAQVRTAGRSMLLVGNPQSRGSFTDEDSRGPPPANVPEDFERLSRLLEARGCEVAQVNEGDAEAVLTRLFARDYRLVLISATAVRQYRQPDGSTVTGFVLSDGLFLTVREIEQMRSVPEVMVLNDYHAGQGGLTEEMVPDLLKVGVRCVVAPAWTLDQRLPTLFCQHLLLALADGQRFEAACFETREAVFKAGPELATWAAYQAWGDPDFSLSPATTAA